MMESPVLPRRGAVVPKVLQVLPIANRVHRVPKSGVPVRLQLTVPHQALHRLPLQHRGVVGKQMEDLRLEDEIAAVDPAFARLRLLGKRANLIAVEIEATEARRRMDGSDGRELAVAAMKCDEIGDIDVRQA